MVDYREVFRKMPMPVLFVKYKLISNEQFKMKIEFINEETESTFLQDSEKKERDSLFSMLFNPNTTIRKKFKKQIQQGSHLNKKAGNSIPVSLTPLELEQYAKLPDDERTHLLHALYEKARYSKDGCTKEDVASFKKS